MSSLQKVISHLQEFTQERDWDQFHNAKDLALAISVEASEVLELFLWKDSTDVNNEELSDELADVMSFCLLLMLKQGLSFEEMMLQKIEKNKLKYPVEKSKGRADKYDKL